MLEVGRFHAMSRWISNFGAWLGNWNDRHSLHDSRSDASLRWRVLDHIASRLYLVGETSNDGSTQ